MIKFDVVSKEQAVRANFVWQVIDEQGKLEKNGKFGLQRDPRRLTLNLSLKVKVTERTATLAQCSATDFDIEKTNSAGKFDHRGKSTKMSTSWSN